MWVQMLEGISGGRPGGGPWPPRGGLIEVSDEEAEELVRKQLARFYSQSEAPASKPEVVKDSEVMEEAKSAPDSDPEVPEPSPSDTKSAWVAYAVSRGAPQEEAESLTKAQLQSAYGGRL